MEAVEPLSLRGGVVAAAEGRRCYQARFVRAGQVRAAGNRPGGIELTAQALQRAWSAGLFNGRAVFVNHSGPGQSPSLHDLVAVTAGARYDDAEGAIEGALKFYDTPTAAGVCRLLDEILAEGGDAPDVGLSIVFWPVWQAGEGETLRRIVDIRHVESVDLVFEPAADGRVLQALSAGRAAAGSLAYPTPVMGKSTKGDLMSDPTDVENHNPSREAASWAAALAETAAHSLVANSGLPAASRERLLGQVRAVEGSAAAFTPDRLAAAIEAERQYLARLAQDGVVQVGGVPPRGAAITGMRTGLDQVGLALDALLAGTRPAGGVAPLSGIRELYHLLSGDYEMNGVFQPERIGFANVTCATMAAMVANALNKRVAAEFQQYPRWWEPVVITEDFNNLQQVRWITLGGLAELPTVAEGAAYTELTWDDKTETADFVKKGGYLGLTLEAIDKDDTGRLRAAPRALAQSAWLALSKAVSNIFTGSAGVGPNLADGVALFDNAHGNLGATALSVTAYTAARAAMRKQTELHSGERLGALTAPRFLLVPPDLEITALQVLASDKDYSYALVNAPAAPDNALVEGETRAERMRFARERVIVVDLWTDSNNWAAVADPRLYPSIGLGFRYGRSPEIFSIASPTSGLMFTNDTMPVKARFFFAVGPVDHRGLYKANVA